MQLRRTIQTIEKWSEDNGMTLNKKKSGIVVFAGRRCKNIPFMTNKKNQEKTNKKNKVIWTSTQTEFMGIPICQKYKYLGTYLDSKLTSRPQIGHIKKRLHTYSLGYTLF